METVLTWIGIALAALVAVAVSVAMWEHYRFVVGGRHGMAAPPAAAHVPLPAGVDVDVDALTRTPPAAHGDSAGRRATLEQAMGRLAQPRAPAPAPAPATGAAAAKAATQRPLSWPDTEPMVGPGVQPELRRAPAKAPSA